MPERITTEYGETIHQVWDVPEYTKYPHSRAWYIGAAVFLVGCIVYAIFFEENYLFAFILLLITIIFAFHEMREPGETQFGITDQGLVWRGFLFPYKEVRAFWIVYDNDVRNIYFTFKKATTPRLTIALDDQDPIEIRETLKQYIFEDLTRGEEPLTDTMGKVLKI
ncbi:MAG: hypothetical protein A2848_02595 [Candidatus Magasanikbacteria bacterium RIFCSPHIGHO2_01_FULL_50_8]|uniref:DUF5673 domain-containing protein n=1 Tax=Candidatus Magasanikbacteria bacterium RIFCSPHIGHO2_01_FULL_50_8 TaxID=1798674 RepID=A0A1F6LVU0_9BACT|nr:MAG: hypothetical protein A2848_02595 [Candidatus Magasanikbacteria bacterium RIFCSPHIGHO2_01_FULL_50_8]